MKNYSKEWMSPLLIAVLIISEFGIVASAFFLELKIIHLILAATLFLLYFTFYSLKINTNQDYLILSFGVGLISITYPISAIDTSFVAENDQILSWVYNPFGKSSLRVKFRDGKQMSLPVSDDLELAAILRNRR